MENLSLWGLFLSAFISSTIAPGGSEAVLAYMVSQKSFSLEQLIIIASVGNTLGALTTWGLGILAAKKYPPEALLSAEKQRSVQLVQKWGYWALLFSWLPVVGDGFCFAGGWLKLPLLLSCLAIFLGKTARYCAVAYLVVTQV
jgi:membrane protein YqaA with SNARE-associated domain